MGRTGSGQAAPDEVEKCSARHDRAEQSQTGLRVAGQDLAGQRQAGLDKVGQNSTRQGSDLFKSVRTMFN